MPVLDRPHRRQFLEELVRRAPTDPDLQGTCFEAVAGNFGTLGFDRENLADPAVQGLIEQLREAMPVTGTRTPLDWSTLARPAPRLGAIVCRAATR